MDRFLMEYKNEGVPMWGLATLNHPLNDYENWHWNSCFFPGEEHGDWIKTYLGPALEINQFTKVKVIIGDDNRNHFPTFAAKARKFSLIIQILTIKFLWIFFLFLYHLFAK